MPTVYNTKFGSLAAFDKGRVEPIDDDVKHYAFSNCFEIAAKAKPFERIVFGQNQQYHLWNNYWKVKALGTYVELFQMT